MSNISFVLYVIYAVAQAVLVMRVFRRSDRCTPDGDLFAFTIGAVGFAPFITLCIIARAIYKSIIFLIKVKND
jgi:hypothetical protein